jgi:hypothetical protein
MARKDKWNGTITTDKRYNDHAETEVAFETFEFNGHTIRLPHPLRDEDDEDRRNPKYVSVDTPSGYSVYIYADDRIEIITPEGYDGVSGSFEVLGRKCRIADKLAAVNQWK